MLRKFDINSLFSCSLRNMLLFLYISIEMGSRALFYFLWELKLKEILKSKKD